MILKLEENLSSLGLEKQGELITSLHKNLDQVQIKGLISLKEIYDYVRGADYLKSRGIPSSSCSFIGEYPRLMANGQLGEEQGREFVDAHLEKDGCRPCLNELLIETHKKSIDYLNDNPNKPIDNSEKFEYLKSNSLLFELIILINLNEGGANFGVPQIELRPKTIESAKNYLKENPSSAKTYAQIEYAITNYLSEIIKTPPEISCLLTEEITDYAEGNLSGKREGEVGLHIATCSDCYEAYELALKIDEILNEDNEELFKDGKIDTTRLKEPPKDFLPDFVKEMMKARNIRQKGGAGEG